NAVPADRARRRVRRRIFEGAADGVRRAGCTTLAASPRVDSRLRASRARADAGIVDSAVSRRVVSASSEVDRMNLSGLGLASAAISGAIPAQRVPVSSGQLLAACRLGWEQGATLVALWIADDRDRGRGFCLRVALNDADGLTILEYTIPDASSAYPDLSAIFPAANRMQRAAFDLVGVASESDDQRPWLWLASWPIDKFPLQRDFVALSKWEPGEETYPFVKVEGDGVHEIPVGPVHAGIIEPGHFRFQVVGEKVLRLEERLGYVHKG